MKINNKMQGGTMNYKTPISFLLFFVAAWITFFYSPASTAVPLEGAAPIVAYGIEVGKFEEIVPGKTDQRRMIARTAAPLENACCQKAS